VDPADKERERRIIEQATAREAMTRASRLRADKEAMGLLADELEERANEREARAARRFEQTARDLKPPNNVWRNRLIPLALAAAAAGATYVIKDWVESRGDVGRVEARVVVVEDDIAEIKDDIDGLDAKADRAQSSLDKLVGKFGLD
jgi:hypothetical protein